MVEANEFGIHYGFASEMKTFIANHREELEPLIAMAKSSKGLVQITGHSYGGAMAQLFTYWLLTEYDFPAEQMSTYTFASPVPFTYEAIVNPMFRNVNVYNVINFTDVIPVVGVTSNNSATVIFETLVNVMNFKGGIVNQGCNLGWNYYIFDSLMGPLRSHKMETYLKLIDAVVSGSIDATCYSMDAYAFGVASNDSWVYEYSAGDRLVYANEWLETEEGWCYYDEVSNTMTYVKNPLQKVNLQDPFK